MIYVYDILLNFLDYPYEFFEWQETDNIKYIKKIPLFRINSKQMKELLENKIIINEEFLLKIENKATFYEEKNKILKYLCIFSDNKIAIGVDFINGKNNISRLLIDEEKEVLDMSSRLEITNLQYDLISENNYQNNGLTREEKKIKNYLLKELELLITNKESDRLIYYYYEYFNKKNKNINEIYESLINSIKNNFNANHIKLYNLMKLSINK